MATQELNPVRKNNEDLKTGGDRTPRTLLKFFDLFAKLYEIKRQGWIKRGIKNPESVADHSLEMAIEALPEISQRGLNRGRVIGMIFVHDLPEIISGDPTPYDEIPDEDLPRALQKWTPPSKEALERKKNQESAALKKVTKNLPRSLRTEIRSLWNEYEDGETEEAKLVHQLDMRQRLSQAMRYRDLEGAKFPIAAFIDEALQSDDPELRKQAEKLKMTYKGFLGRINRFFIP
ncbi:MAG: HD domain-containing protein [bacterium]|nr:HD domain-containing protein [bacterium]